MNPCCIESLVRLGIRTGFRPARAGESHICEACKTRLVLRLNLEYSTPDRQCLTWQEQTPERTH